MRMTELCTCTYYIHEHYTAHEGFSRYISTPPEGGVLIYQLSPFVHALQCVAMSAACLFVNAAVFRRLH